MVMSVEDMRGAAGGLYCLKHAAVDGWTADHGMLQGSFFM